MLHSSLRSLRVWSCVLLLCSAAGCDGAEEIEPESELDVAPAEPGGKADALSVATIPVASYATEAWPALNKWEDTSTPAAREAGIAWPADSGLTWDQKYALWIESMPMIDRWDGWGATFELTTPFGDKSLPAPRLDCADVTLLLRASFAAWYNLPFVVIASDGGTKVYFGHFGIRTAAGNWNNMPLFKSAYSDYSWMSPSEYENSWPKDPGLRKLGVQDGDEQPFLGEGARTGTYLDEIHLNKRAARFIRLLMVLTGSMHLADARNLYNLAPEALRAGDTNLWRWQAQGVGHTMVTMRVDTSIPGMLPAHSVFGNLPPDQPMWEDEVATKFSYTDARGGGADDTGDYAKLGGGIKRWRVTKNVGGVWRNTMMNADQASWIDSTNHDALRERPTTFSTLLGEATPDAQRDALLGVIEARRMHLRMLPASCSARTAREKAFTKLYELMATEFGMTQLEVDREFRSVEDYVFAELVYQKSRTCCWNSTTPAMYDTIIDHDATLRQGSPVCTPPLVFKARDKDYAIYRDHNPVGWKNWSADESCPQASTVVDDLEAPVQASAFCDVFAP